jgi:membrane complex biogenesis BtpA family protein
MTGVFRPKGDALTEFVGHRRAVIGVVHLVALPGSPGYRGEPLEVLRARALEDARRYARGGVHALIVENHGDIPFAKPDALGPETAAVMAVLADAVRRETGLPLGINVLANAAHHALAVAQAAQAQFVRVNQWANAYVANEGILEGPAAAATRYRSALRAEHLRVFADVHVKHGAHAITADRGLPELTRDLEFFDADAVIVTGERTGDGANLGELAVVRDSTQLPLLVGSGVTPETVASVLEIADGVIVASALKEGGVWWNAVDEARVRGFMARVG